MTKIKKMPSKKSKKLLLVPIGVVLITLIVIGVLQATHTIHLFQSASSRQKQQEAQYNATAKSQAENNKGNPSSTDSSGNASATTETYTAPSNANGITITPAQDGDKVTIVTKLVGYSDGTCQLSIQNADTGKVYSQDVDVVFAPDYSTCAGFSVPVSDLGTGNWSISLSVVSGGNTNNKTTSLSVK